MAKFEEAILDNTKSGWNRLGAFDPKERSHVLDLFGYSVQWILPTFSFHQIAHTENLEVLEVGASTLNKAMATFCKSDERLKAIGYIPLKLGPRKALEIMERGFDDGCYSFMIDTNEPNDENISFTHPDFDPIWNSFAQNNSPSLFMWQLMVTTRLYRKVSRIMVKLSLSLEEMLLLESLD